MQSKGTQVLKQKTTIHSKSQKEQKSLKAKQPLQQPSKGKIKSISTAMTSANSKFEKEKQMLNANELCKAGRFCVELHNYYILNWKKIDVIVVKYRHSHFLMDDGLFIISLSDLYNLFNLDALDVSLMRCFAL
jgi:predicted PolB exonuclease-like 3'-5' exonuclease